MIDVIAQPLVRVLRDGQPWTFHPLVVQDWCAFCAWINAQNGKHGELLTLDEMAAAAETVAGMAWLCWRATRRAHPTQTLEDLQDRMTVDDLRVVMPAITDLPKEAGGMADPILAMATSTG